MNKHEEGIQEYSCPGCIHGPGPESCENFRPSTSGCLDHYAGTMELGIGVIALGLPRGFSRFGLSLRRRVEVFLSWQELVQSEMNVNTIYSVAVWKHLNEKGHTIIRWFSPRTNMGWSAVILEDCRDKIPNAIEITQENIDYMD